MLQLVEEQPDTANGATVLGLEAHRCDNIVWNRHRKQAERCDRLLLRAVLQPGSRVEIICPKCGKKFLKGG